MSKKLLLALSLVACAVQAQAIKPQTKGTSSEQSLKTGTQSTSTTVASVKNRPKEEISTSNRRSKRRRGAIAGVLSFIGLSVLAIIGYVISCIP